MKRKVMTNFLLLGVMLLFGARDYRGQEPPELPEPPEPPEFVMPGPGMQVFTGDGAAWLGVTLKDVTAEMAQDLKLPGEYGALVESVEAESAASKAGLQKGDVIVEFAGERVRSMAQLRRLIRETPADRTVTLQIVRDGQTRTLSAKLRPRANQFYFRGGPEIRVPVPETRVAPDIRGFKFLFDGGRPSLGISGDELTTQLASYFGVKQGKGVLVREVVLGSPAAKAGLKAGDVIVAVDGKGIATVAELRQALDGKGSEEKQKLSLTVVRERHELTVPVELEKQGAIEPESVASAFGIDAAALRHAAREVKAQMAAAQSALQEAREELCAQSTQCSL
jgi:C-terminal processing protease CtpA/Prc